MLRVRYTAWDGTQQIRLTADQLFDKLGDFLAYTDDVQQALDWLLHQGLDWEGIRVMGLDELLEELRSTMRERMQDLHLRDAFAELRQRLDDLLEQEREALDEAGDDERTRAKRAQIDQLPPRLSEAIEALRSYPFESSEAQAAFADLLDELDDVKGLEDFQRRYGDYLRGARGLSFEEAVELMREMERWRALEEALLSGHLEGIDPDELRAMLGPEAARSLELLRNVVAMLSGAGYLMQREGRTTLTPRGVRKLGQLALRDIYQGLLRDRSGGHQSDHRGVTQRRPEETHRYAFGDPFELDVVATLRHALARGSLNPLRIAPEDFQVHATDRTTTSSTVLLLDMSWSMSWEGRFAAAKRVALALESLIRAKFPRDYFAIVGFYTRAVELKLRDLPEASWNMGDPFTNLQDGLRLASELLTKHPSPNQHIIVITDGQPTAYFLRGRLYCEWPLSFGGISMRAAQETLKEVERVTRRGIVINTFMLDDSPSLRAFVERMTRINKGRALYTRPDRLGQYLLVDYLAKKKKRV
jgi:uncharacterized protein with von Willebrand factor type A (vWA) domain